MELYPGKSSSPTISEDFFPASKVWELMSRHVNTPDNGDLNFRVLTDGPDSPTSLSHAVFSYFT